MTVKSTQSPLAPMIGEWEEEGRVLNDRSSQPIYSHSTCSSLTSPNDMICNGQSGEDYAWLDVYRWDPKTETIDFKSLSTTSGERICEGTGTWDSATQTLSIDAIIRDTHGDQRGVRLTRVLSEEGSRLEYYSTMSGKEIRTLEVQSRSHHGLEIDFKLPFALLNGSYKSWLRIAIDPQQDILQGCRTEQQGGECEPQTIELSSEDLQEYYVHKQHVMSVQACSSVAPHAHDIMAEVRLIDKTYRNTFYYNPNGMEHHHVDDSCPQVSELAEWVYTLWDERKLEELD